MFAKKGFFHTLGTMKPNMLFLLIHLKVNCRDPWLEGVD